jgi:chromosome segregation ATPase
MATENTETLDDLRKQRAAQERAITDLQGELRTMTAERDEWRRLSGEWQKRAERLRDDMATINVKATELGETVKRLQVLMKS